MPTMMSVMQDNASNSASALLHYFSKNINSKDIAKYIDISASVLEPECLDVVCGPLRTRKMPTFDADPCDAELGLSPLNNLHWCIGEFIFAVPGNNNTLKGLEKIYLLFCFWYCEYFNHDDDRSKSLIKLLIAAIELNNEKLLGLLLEYFRSAFELISISGEIDSGGMFMAIEILNMNIPVSTEKPLFSEYKNFLDKIHNSDFDPDVKVLWLDAVNRLSQLDLGSSDAVEVHKSS